MITRKKVSLKLFSRTPENKVEFGRSIYTATNGNATFSATASLLPALKTACDNLEAAIIAARNGGTNNTALLHQQETALDNILTLVANTIENTANSTPGVDAEVIISNAGLSYRHTATPSPVPLAPLNFNSTSSSVEGQINLKFNRVKYARVYVIEQCDDVTTLNQAGNRTIGSPVVLPSPIPSPTPAVPPLNDGASWHIVAIITKSKAVINNLVSGQKYAFRVYCVGSAGNSAYSPTVIAKAF